MHGMNHISFPNQSFSQRLRK